MIRRAIAAALIGTASPQVQPDEATRVAAAVAARAGEWPGCAIGVYKDGKVAEFVTAGYADVDKKVPITADSPFYVASMSKQFTALALLQLVAAGRVALDRDVREYIPQLPVYQRPITLQMLLNHTAGIADDINVALVEGRFDATRTTRADALAMLYRQKELRFTPGTRFEYSNGGYLLISEVVERVSGEPFADYVGRHILQPLGMTHSFVMNGEAPAGVALVRGYSVPGDEVLNANRYSRFGGAAGLVTTVSDLGKWDRDIDSGHRVWTSAIGRLMLTPGRFANGAPVSRRGTSIPYASGLVVGPNWFHHTGDVTGFASLYARDSARRLGIAMLCNNGALDIYARARAVLAAIDPGLPSIEEVPTNPHPLDGRYRNPSLAALYTVVRTPEGLNLTIAAPDGDAPTIPLTPTADGQFRKTGLFLNPDDDNDGFTLSIGFVSYHLTRVAS